MFEELGKIEEGCSIARPKINNYSRLILNIKVNKALSIAVAKENTGYDDVCCIIIANLLAKKGKVGYSRDTSITEPKKYNKKGISNYRIVRAIDSLVNLGLVDNYISTQSFNNDYLKETSHIEATALLWSKFGSFKNVKHSRQSLVKDRQCVILKDASGKRIEYKDTSEIKVLREKLTDYNTYANEFVVALHGEELSTTLDAHHKYSLNEYGRFYGAAYQTIKKEERKEVTINEENIIEIDFQNLHFRMLLDMYLLSHHVTATTDLYSYPLSEEQLQNPDNRKAIKSMFNMIINCSNRTSALKAMNSAVYQGDSTLGEFGSAKDVYQCLVDAYPFIFDNPSVMSNIHSGKPLAAVLQKRERDIALEIMTVCQQVGFIVCPIHDSFFADASNAYLLAKIIGDSYRKEMNTSAGVAVSVIMKDKTWKQIV